MRADSSSTPPSALDSVLARLSALEAEARERGKAVAKEEEKEETEEDDFELFGSDDEVLSSSRRYFSSLYRFSQHRKLVLRQRD